MSTDNSKTTDYDAILHSEIGDNTIKSQKKYCKNIVNDSNARFVDTQIETIYVQRQGLPSNILNPNAPSKPASLSTTAISGIDEDL